MNRLLVLLLGAAFAGCGRAPEPVPRSAPASTAYEVKGVLQEVRAEGLRAVIAHEAIAGYMEAMTMEFDVQDTPEMARLAPGDVLAFRLTVTESHGWIDRVRKVGHTTPAPPAATGEALPPGSPLPDCALTDARGQPLRLSDFKGRALALTFIFTRCPFPDYCPLMNRHLVAAQRALATGSATNWQLLSLSFDPAYDTPERLAKYATQYQPDPARWTFATGRAEDVRKLGAAFGLAITAEGKPLNHNLRTVVVDPAGRVQKVFNGNEWQAEDLVAEMRRAMSAKP